MAIKKVVSKKTLPKAQKGITVVRGSRPKLGVFKTTKERTTSGGLFEPYKYKTESMDTTGYSKGKSSYKLITKEGEGDKTGSKVTSNKAKSISKKEVPSILKKLKMKNGGSTQKCWPGYKKQGSKTGQSGKTVNNCVKK